MASIVSKIVVVLVNRELSDTSASQEASLLIISSNDKLKRHHCTEMREHHGVVSYHYFNEKFQNLTKKSQKVSMLKYDYNHVLAYSVKTRWLKS